MLDGGYWILDTGYWMLEINKIYCENCLNLMARMPEDFVDLTVTSPPYDNLRTYNGYVFEFEKIAKELYRVTKPGGVVVWIVNDSTVNGSETLTSCKQKIFFREECGFNIHDTMIYRTNKPPMNDNRYQSEFEYMFIFVKGNLVKFNPIKIKSLHPNVKHTGGHRKITGEKTNHIRKNERTAEYKLKGNIWYLPRSSKSGDKFSREHPATFPEQLAEDHIKSWSNEGDLIYDPMCGSGTVPKMAIKLNRNWIASEISAEYVAIAEKRIQREQSILKLKLME